MDFKNPQGPPAEPQLKRVHKTQINVLDTWPIKVITSFDYPLPLQATLFDSFGTQVKGPWEVLTSPSWFSNVSTTVVGSQCEYSLTPIDLPTLFDSPGQYKMAFAIDEAPSFDNRGVTFVVSPEDVFKVRFHYRDHVGSSTMSKAYTSSDGNSNSDLTKAIICKRVAVSPSGMTNVLDDDHMTLFPEPPEFGFFEPYGHRMDCNDSATDDDVRFTDHEYDQSTGFNSMKGRYQLPVYAKFNRPDPMRDWDWLRPHTLNLYEYCGNDPVTGWDPDGQVWHIVAGAGLGAIVGGGMELGRQLFNGEPVSWRRVGGAAAGGAVAGTIFTATAGAGVAGSLTLLESMGLGGVAEVRTQMLFVEYQVVEATRKLSDNVETQCIGTVLLVLSSEDKSLGYEVEFVNGQGDTVDILTVTAEDIRPVVQESQYSGPRKRPNPWKSGDE